MSFRGISKVNVNIVAIGQSVGRYSSKSYFLTQTIESKFKIFEIS